MGGKWCTIFPPCYHFPPKKCLLHFSNTFFGIFASKLPFYCDIWVYFDTLSKLFVDVDSKF